MAKLLIEDSTLKNLANAIRKVNGVERTYTPNEMIEAVTNIMDSAAYILVDENGNETPAIYVDSEVLLTANSNDIRAGKTAVTEDGVTEGTKDIPAYHTTEGIKIVTAGSPYIIELTEGRHKYTKFQALICRFNTSASDSVASEKVVINDNVYEVGYTVSISLVTSDDSNSIIDLGISNSGDTISVLRYFTYKEEY